MTPYLQAVSLPNPFAELKRHLAQNCHLISLFVDNIVDLWCPLNCPPALRLHCGLGEGQKGQGGLRRPIIAAGQPRAGSFLSSSRVQHAELGGNPTLASGIPECQLSEALKLGGAEAPLSFHHGTLEDMSYLIPKDRVGLIATHRQGIPLQTEVHRSIMIPDIGHVLKGKAERPQASSSPVALLWVDLWHLLLHWR